MQGCVCVGGVSLIGEPPPCPSGQQLIASFSPKAFQRDFRDTVSASPFSPCTLDSPLEGRWLHRATATRSLWGEQRYEGRRLQGAVHLAVKHWVGFEPGRRQSGQGQRQDQSPQTRENVRLRYLKQ